MRSTQADPSRRGDVETLMDHIEHLGNEVQLRIFNCCNLLHPLLVGARRHFKEDQCEQNQNITVLEPNIVCSSDC